MEVELNYIDNLDVWQRDLVVNAHDRGITSNQVIANGQPAPWMLRGLQILESDQELTVEKIKRINLSGGTDHPDPTISI